MNKQSESLSGYRQAIQLAKPTTAAKKKHNYNNIALCVYDQINVDR